MLLAIIIALNFDLLDVHNARLLYREEAALLLLISCTAAITGHISLLIGSFLQNYGHFGAYGISQTDCQRWNLFLRLASHRFYVGTFTENL